MSTKRQDAFVAWVNKNNQIATLLSNAYQLCKEADADSTKENWLSLAQSMQTSPVNADQMQSNTPDGAPNAAHPITAPDIGISWNTLNGMAVLRTQFQNLMNNSAVSTIDGFLYCSDMLNGK